MNIKWQPIVPDSFTVPVNHQVEDFIFTPLGVKDIDPDFIAVMGSLNRLKGTFDFVPDWPDPRMTKEEDLANLGWHQTEFALKTSFAYKITAAKDNDYIGCAYIFPSNNPQFEVDAYLWVKNGYEPIKLKLIQLFKDWLKTWPFTKVNFPAKI